MESRTLQLSRKSAAVGGGRGRDCPLAPARAGQRQVLQQGMKGVQKHHGATARREGGERGVWVASHVCTERERHKHKCCVRERHTGGVRRPSEATGGEALGATLASTRHPRATLTKRTASSADPTPRQAGRTVALWAGTGVRSRSAPHLVGWRWRTVRCRRQTPVLGSPGAPRVVLAEAAETRPGTKRELSWSERMEMTQNGEPEQSLRRQPPAGHVRAQSPPLGRTHYLVTDPAGRPVLPNHRLRARGTSHRNTHTLSSLLSKMERNSRRRKFWQFATSCHRHPAAVMPRAPRAARRMLLPPAELPGTSSAHTCPTRGHGVPGRL